MYFVTTVIVMTSLCLTFQNFNDFTNKWQCNLSTTDLMEHNSLDATLDQKLPTQYYAQYGLFKKGCYVELFRNRNDKTYELKGNLGNG